MEEPMIGNGDTVEDDDEELELDEDEYALPPGERAPPPVADGTADTS